MKSIYKYQIDIVDEQTLSVPLGSQILSLQEQYNTMVVYALVDVDEKEVEQLNFRVHGTGHKLDDKISEFYYLGTVKFMGGNLMFHVFYN